MENWDNLSVEWLCRRARMLSDNGYVQRGLVYQLVAYHMQPSNESVQRGLAKMFVLAGDGVRALAIIKKLEEKKLDPEDSALLLLRANAFLAMGNSEEASKILAQHLNETGDRK